MNLTDTIPHRDPDDSTVDAMAEIDEQVAAGQPVCPSNGVLVGAEFENCLQLLNRVRRHRPNCVADYVNADVVVGPWIDGGNEFPPQIGRFQIVRKLGQGGFGLVFLAFDPELDRQLALKVPRIEALVTEQTRDRFLREGKAAASLDHANIAAVYEAGRIGPICYIASAYCEGGSLADLLKAVSDGTVPRPTYGQTASLMLTLAGAVQHAHSRGILHRDLKPGNVMFDTSDAGANGAQYPSWESARIVDFGLAQTAGADGSDTHTGALLGTPAYMSPEQAAGDRDSICPASDIYSLGSILYELLTGRPPLKKESEAETIVAVKHEEPIPPRQINRDCPPDIAAICQKCLEKSPKSRYHSGTELADELRRFLAGKTVMARPITRTEMLRRWCRRNPALALLSVALLVVLLLLIFGSTAATVWLAQARKDTLDSLEAEILAKDRLTESEELALKAVFEARLAQVRAGRQMRAPGQRLDGIDALARASALIPRLKLGEDDVRVLRNEAIACLGLVDLDDELQWPLEDADVVFATDSTVERYAMAQRGTGDIVIRRLSDNSLLATLRQSDDGVSVQNLMFSPKGDYLACSWDRDGKLPRVQVWNVERQEVVRMIRCSAFSSRTFDFTRDGLMFVVGASRGSLKTFRVPGFSAAQSFAESEPSELIEYHPDGSRLVAHRGGQLEIVDAKTGKVIRAMDCEKPPRHLDWSQDGFLLASAESGGVTLWRTSTGRRYRYLNQPSPPLHVSFHPSGRVASVYCQDNRTRLWDIADGTRLLTVDGGSTNFSRDGRRLGKPAGRWKVVLPESHVAFPQPQLAGAITSTGRVSVHKDGRLASADNRSQIVFRDLATRTTIATVPTEMSSGALLPTGDDYVTSDLNGISLRSVTVTQTEGEVDYSIGPAKRIAEGACGHLTFDGRGEVISCIDRYHLGRVVLHNARTGFSGILTPPHFHARYGDMTTDGKLLATGAWRGKDVRVWDAGSGKLLRTIPSGDAEVAFSPDGTMLAVDEGRRFTVWRVGPWTQIVQRTKMPLGTTVPRCLVFSPDGRMLAVQSSQNSIQLLDTNGFKELAELRIPIVNIVESLTFTAQGDRLIAGVRGDACSLHVWDLQVLRGELKRINLDWDHPPLPARNNDASVPLKLKFSPQK